MTARSPGHSSTAVRQAGNRPRPALLPVALLLVAALTGAGCATATAGQGPEPGSARIVRRPESRELREGMSRSQVEERVGPLLLRERMGDDLVYVEPVSRCMYLFDRRDLLREWSCR